MSVVAFLQKTQKRFRFVLYPFSLLYAFVLYLRRAVWWKYIQKPYSSFVPVISIGNIAWGGTGKTPIVDYMLSLYEKNSLHITLISRGYKGSATKLPLHVLVKKSHTNENTTPEECGDEPYMLARNHQQSSVLVDYNRRRAIEFAEENLKQACFILDDAMQHIAVERDINIVLLRIEDVYEEWNCVIPCGSWREPVYALSSATAFCIKATEQEWKEHYIQIQKRLSVYAIPLFSFSLRINVLLEVLTNQVYFPKANQPYSIVSGIGKPQSFKQSIIEFMGYPPVEEYICRDHATQEELYTAIQHCTGLIICTEKDAVKMLDTTHNIVYAKAECVFGNAIAPYSFSEYCLEALQSYI